MQSVILLPVLELFADARAHQDLAVRWVDTDMTLVEKLVDALAKGRARDRVVISLPESGGQNCDFPGSRLANPVEESAVSVQVSQL